MAGRSLIKFEQGVSKLVPVNHRKVWEIVRKTDPAMGVGDTCH